MTGIKSKALEANLATTYVDVAIDPKFECIQAVMSRYYGLMEGVNTFLQELSHPYRNWQFIVSEARTYALDYFHLFQPHPRGVEATGVMVDIFNEVIAADVEDSVAADAVDNLLLYLRQIIDASRDRLPDFLPVIIGAFNKINNCPDDRFFLFASSFYPIKRIIRLLGDRGSGIIADYSVLNALSIRTFATTYDFWCGIKDPWESFESSAGQINNPDRVQKCFSSISHKVLDDWKDRLDQMARESDQSSRTLFDQLLTLTDFAAIVEKYRRLPQILMENRYNPRTRQSMEGDFPLPHPGDHRVEINPRRGPSRYQSNGGLVD